MRPILRASLALLAAVVLHDLDHVRQDRSVEPLVVAIGVIGDIAVITLVALAIRGSRWTSLAAVVVGFGNVLGFFAVHVIPDWGPLADGYPGLGVDAVSWIAVAIPMVVAAVLGVIGLRRLQPQAEPS
jgi:hypothetical protein